MKLDVETLHRALGTFWYRCFDKPEEVRALLESVLTVQEQIQQDTDDLVASVSRKTIPVYRTVHWFPLTISREDYERSTKKYAKYNGQQQYDSIVQYDVLLETIPRVELPSGIISIESVSDSIVNPQVQLQATVEDGFLALASSPFSGQFPIENDKVTLWLHNVLWDTDQLYKQFGYALGIRLPSSESYKRLINVLYDVLLHGPSHATSMEFLSILTGIPICATDNETVRDIQHNTVITDRNQYIFPEEDVLTVAIGDILPLAETMSEGLCITNDIPGLQLGSDLFSICQAMSLLFENSELPVVVQQEDELTKMIFPVKGTIDSVDWFNDQLHKRGEEQYEEITDACELEQIYKVYPDLRPTSPEPPIPPVSDIINGLESYLHFHRFN